jgi:acetyl esterase
MPLDPQARAVLDRLAAAGIPPTHQLSVSEARRALVARRALTSGQAEPIARVEERMIPGLAGDLRLRVYAPVASGRLPVLVYFHGGGWVIGSLDTHDSICRGLANAAGCLLVSVDYRLAPEHKFPAAAEDAYAATVWVADNATMLEADGARLAIGGDSAGGNLAAVVALMARDRAGPAITHQLLLYPVTDYSFDTLSYRENADGYGLSRDDMVWFWRHYLSVEAEGEHPYASPLKTDDLSGLPPVLVITAEFDPLRDEGQAYAARLGAAGVRVASTCYPGTIHGFLAMAAVLDQGREAIQEAGAALRAAFAH